MIRLIHCAEPLVYNSLVYKQLYTFRDSKRSKL
nr:MAG TPA: hypothetical protein [Caudoviricetes sp.]